MSTKNNERLEIAFLDEEATELSVPTTQKKRTTSNPTNNNAGTKSPIVTSTTRRNASYDPKKFEDSDSRVTYTRNGKVVFEGSFDEFQKLYSRSFFEKFSDWFSTRISKVKAWRKNRKNKKESSKERDNYDVEQPKKRHGCAKGCLTSFIIGFIVVVVIWIIIFQIAH